MKILFIYKNIYIYEFKALPQLSAVLKKHGHEVKLAFAEREDIDKIIREWKPKIVGFSITTGFHKYYINLGRKLKKKHNIFTIYGGPHATYFPEIINDYGVDSVCVGEGELAILDFINMFGTEKIKHIPNWWVKTDGKIYKNEVRHLIEDLDSIPLWDRELLYNKDKFLKNNPQKTFIVTRGCPYRCTFCHNAAYLDMYQGKGKMVRTRSVNSVIEEIELVKSKYPLGLVRFDDDFFGVDLKWLKEFCDKYKSKINIPFHCRFSADMATEERVQLLKKAGCVSVQLGIETGSDIMRKKVLKKPNTNEQHINACNLLRKHHILVILDNIIGYPGENLNSIFKTLEINIKCKPAYSWVTLFQPYPKTPLGDFAVKNGYFDGNYNKLDYNYYMKSALKFRSKSEKIQTENLQKLFAITVSFPRLYPITKLLIKLPLTKIYEIMYRLWYGYTHQFIFPMKLTPSQWFSTVKRFLVKDKA